MQIVTLEFDGEERFQTLRKELGATSLGINLIRLAPRQRGRIHRHGVQEEVYVVLEGTLTLVVEGEPHEIGERQVVRIAPDERRQLVNTSETPLVLLAVGAGGDHPGRDGEAFESWEDTDGRPPQEVPLPEDLPA
jgi:mannose-6-phosphate isomerase-like protein (cupin superfamily)